MFAYFDVQLEHLAESNIIGFTLTVADETSSHTLIVQLKVRCLD